jgi:hypothetical protein
MHTRVHRFFGVYLVDLGGFWWIFGGFWWMFGGFWWIFGGCF